MKNNLVKWIRIFLLIILSIVNIRLYIFSIRLFIYSIFLGFYGAAYGTLEAMSKATFIMCAIGIIFTVILGLNLIITLMKNWIHYKEKNKISSFFYIMLLFIINITTTLLGLLNIGFLRILIIFYVIYFIVKERKGKINDKHNNEKF